MYIEPECKIDHGKFQKDQPQASRCKEAPGGCVIIPVLYRNEGRRTCKENKNRCTEMCDPPGEEKDWRRCREIERILCKRTYMHEIAGMVKSHDDHYQTPHNINGINALLHHITPLPKWQQSG
jgi:hypothetical protein